MCLGCPIWLLFLVLQMCILDKLAIFMYMHISKHLPVTVFFSVAELNLVLIFCFGSSPRIQHWHTNGLWVQQLCMNVQRTRKGIGSQKGKRINIYYGANWFSGALLSFFAFLIWSLYSSGIKFKTNGKLQDRRITRWCRGMTSSSNG